MRLPLFQPYPMPIFMNESHLTKSSLNNRLYIKSKEAWGKYYSGLEEFYLNAHPGIHNIPTSAIPIVSVHS